MTSRTLSPRPYAAAGEGNGEDGTLGAFPAGSADAAAANAAAAAQAAAAQAANQREADSESDVEEEEASVPTAEEAVVPLLASLPAARCPHLILVRPARYCSPHFRLLHSQGAHMVSTNQPLRHFKRTDQGE